METDAIKRILEGALLAAGRPLSLNDLEGLFTGDVDAPPRDAIRAALAELSEDWQARSLALQEVASGYRAQVREEFEPWLARLWDEKPPRYSRALLETLAIIAYRQPITRSEIEDIRGVSVSTQIMRTLTEREWVRVVGQRDAPGRPAMYGTTRQFLDHFNLKNLDQLPELSELSEANSQHPELEFESEPAGNTAAADAENAADEDDTGAASTGDDSEAAAQQRSDTEDGTTGGDVALARTGDAEASAEAELDEDADGRPPSEEATSAAFAAGRESDQAEGDGATGDDPDASATPDAEDDSCTRVS